MSRLLFDDKLKGTLQILSTNIIEYVLNLYLNYEEDIIKLKKLYEYKFNIKPHIKRNKSMIVGINYIQVDYSLIYKYDYYDNGNRKEQRKYKNSLAANLKIVKQQYGCQRNWYKNGLLKAEYYKSNNHRGGTGICKKWNRDGNIQTEIELINGYIEGIFKFYTVKDVLKYEIDFSKMKTYEFLKYRKDINFALKDMGISYI
jgi:antitoxin component YwqK of YwqJK toxin-antitoxin module